MTTLIRNAATAGATLTAGALYTRARSAQFTRRSVPRGKFVACDGASLHVLDAGVGETVLLLHGNATSAEDWRLAGVFDALRARRRVLAPDRPGYGASARPRDRVWTLKAQADLMAALLRQEKAGPATIVAHSLATQIALLLALDHPDVVRGLVLVSGYYFPSPRLDSAAGALVASPGAGSLYRQTLATPVGELAAPLALKAMFAPSRPPLRFRREIFDQSLRPRQLRACNADGAYMLPSAMSTALRLDDLRTPIVIVAGEDDRIVDTERQSGRLARRVARTHLHVVPNVGHMVQHQSPEAILSAVDEVAAQTAPARLTSHRRIWFTLGARTTSRRPSISGNAH